MTERNEHHAFKADEIPCWEISDPAVLSKTPLVSVNMITYNHEPYIAQAIEGVLMQETDFPIELVIGEDCSTDRTREIVLDYQKKHPDIIRVVTSEHNVGMTKNDLRTNKACRGKYIAFCEGDDYWHYPGKLQKQVEFLESHPDFGLVHTDFDQEYKKNNEYIRAVNKTKKIIIPEGNIFDDFLGDIWIVHTQTAVVRANLINSYHDFIQKHQEESKKWNYGDWPLFAFIAIQSKIKYFDYSPATYRIIENSMCHPTDFMTKTDNAISLYNCKLFYSQIFPCTNEILKKRLKIHLARSILKKGFFIHNRNLSRKGFNILRKYHRLTYKDYIYYSLSFNVLLNKLANKFILLKSSLTAQA